MVSGNGNKEGSQTPFSFLQKISTKYKRSQDYSITIWRDLTDHKFKTQTNLTRKKNGTGT